MTKVAWLKSPTPKRKKGISPMEHSMGIQENPSLNTINPLPPISDLKNNNDLLSIDSENIKQFVDQRLKQIGYVYSPTQKNTPKDGNCFIHAILDQMR